MFEVSGTEPSGLRIKIDKEEKLIWKIFYDLDKDDDKKFFLLNFVLELRENV